MPPRKQNKSTPAQPPLIKKKYSIDNENKRRIRANGSSQRLLTAQQREKPKPKRGKHATNVTTNQGIKKEIEDEDAFGLSPAYLCECALQNQETSVIQKEPSYFNKSKSQSDPSQRRKGSYNKKTTVNSGINGINEEYCPALLCESILETEVKPVLGRILPKSTSKNSFKNINQTRNIERKSIAKPSNNKFSNEKVFNDNKASKSNNKNSYNEEYFPTLLCETILRTEDNSATDPTSKSMPNNKLVKISNKRKHKSSDETTQNEVQGQGYGLMYLFENKSKYKDISLFPVPNNSKGSSCKNNFPKSSPQKKRKLLVDNKKCNLGKEENIDTQEYSTAFLCESVISSEETQTPDLSGKNRSSNKLRKGEGLKKTKINQMSTNYNSNELLHNAVEKRLGNYTQNRTGKDTSMRVLEYGDTKENLSTVSSVGALSHSRNKPHRSVNNVVNKKKCAKKSRKKGTCKNVPKTPKTFSEGNCSLKNLFERDQERDIRLLETHLGDTKEVSGTRKRKRNNDLSKKSEKPTSKNLSNRTVQCDDFSVVSKLDPLKVKICRTRSSKLKCVPLEIKNLRNVEELTTDVSHTQEYENSISCEEPSDSEMVSVMSESSSDAKENQLSRKQNNHLQEHNTINPSGNTLQSYVFPDNRLPSCSFEENKMTFSSSENNVLETDGNPSLKEESTIEGHKNSVEDESKHSNLNQEIRVDKISFVECNVISKQNEFSWVFGSVDPKLEMDPLEWNSTDMNLSECKLTTLKTDLVKTFENTPLENKEVNVNDVSTDDSLDCDLHLECTVEDTEILKLEFQDRDSEENDILGISPSFEIVVTSSLERFSLSNLKLVKDKDSLFTLSSQLKVTHELMNNNEKIKIEKQPCFIKPHHLEGVDDVESMYCRGENDSIKTISLLSDVSAKINEEIHEKTEGVKESHIDTTDSEGSFNTSVSEKIIKTDSDEGGRIELEVHSIIDEIISKAVDSNLSSTENVCLEDKSHCLLKIQPIELMPKNKQPDYITNGDCKQKDDRNELYDQLRESTGGQICGTPESFSKTGSVRVSKESLKFHEERVLKVLLHRLEDEDIFKFWKKNGAIPLMKRSLLKSSIGHKKPCSKKKNIQKSFKKKSDFKCFACKKSFKNRERFWEHRASKCDTLRVFGCSNCNRKYILKKMLDDHKVKCLLVKHFRCKECFKLFNSQERLDEHIVSKCDTQKVFQCDVCDRNFIFKRLLIIHRTPICTSLRRYKCSICDQLYDDISSLKSHKLKEHGIGSMSSCLCEVCGKLVSRKYFSSHLSTHLSDKSMLFRCKICPEVFASKVAMHHHENCHKDLKPCICADCGKAFNKLQDLKKHVSRHSSVNKCNICGKVIMNQFCFRAHVVRHNEVKSSSGDSSMVKIKEEQFDEYSESIGMGKLLESSRSEELKTELQSLHKFSSDVDDAVVKNSQYQDSSMNKTGYFNCIWCRYRCQKKENLLEHMKFHQDPKTNNPQLFKCEKCGNVFSKMENLKRHYRRMHNTPKTVKEIIKVPTAERPYPCEICRTCFRGKKDLRRHIARVHRKDRESLFHCAFCDEKFTNEVIFKNHTFEHINNSIQCTSLSVNIAEEENQSNNADDKILKNCFEKPKKEKPYVCDLCGNRFELKSSLRRHQAKVHSIKRNDQEEYTHKEDNGARNSKQPEEAPINIDDKEGLDLISSSTVQGCLDRSPERNSCIDSKQNKKSYACRECGKIFTTEYCKKRHVCLDKLNSLESTLGRNIHACRECGVVFFDSWRLNRHLLSHNPLALRCHVCKKCFTSQLKLNVHMLVHGIKTSEQPTFQCLTCNKLFPSSKKLEEHSILHTDLNPYQCAKCNRKFTCSSSLKRHNDSTHADKRFLCSYCNISFVAFSSLNQHVTHVHNKAVSLTEYILRIDDNSMIEATEPTLTNMQTDSTAEVDLQPQVFTNICNMFVGDTFQASTLPSPKQHEVSHTVVNPDHIIGESRLGACPSEVSISYTQ